MRFRGFFIGAVVLSLGRPALAQIPSVPAAPAVPAAAAPATTTPVPTIWDKLGLTQQCCDNCMAKCCASPLGQLLNNMTKPLTFATGGLVGPLCPPTPTANDLKNLLGPDSTASDAEKTAASIKADEAGAAKRRAAIRYLGTVDCHYYPEAESALVSGLRGDRNECVRYEAALALSKGCCCTRKTMAALLITANGGDSDGNPSEKSERVRALAMHALQLCTCRAGEQRAIQQQQPERPPEPPEHPPGKIGLGSQTEVQLAVHNVPPAAPQTQPQLVDQASRLLAETIGTTSTMPMPLQPTGRRNLAGIFASVVGTPDIAPNDANAFDEAVLTLPDLP